MKIVRPEDRLWEVLQFDKRTPHIISVVGAGGKTTLIRRLSGELADRGVTVLISTTTKMYRPEEGYCEWRGSKSVKEVQKRIQRERILTIGCTCKGIGERAKITGIPKEDYGLLVSLADVLLIEADGSRQKPIKVPAEHEPVLYPGTELVVGVLGLRSVGKKIREVAHRPLDVAAFLGTDMEHEITVEDIEQIMESPAGLRKGVDCAYVAVGNEYESGIL